MSIFGQWWLRVHDKSHRATNIPYIVKGYNSSWLWWWGASNDRHKGSGFQYKPQEQYNVGSTTKYSTVYYYTDHKNSSLYCKKHYNYSCFTIYGQVSVQASTTDSTTHKLFTAQCGPEELIYKQGAKDGTVQPHKLGQLGKEMSLLLSRSTYHQTKNLN